MDFWSDPGRAKERRWSSGEAPPFLLVGGILTWGGKERDLQNSSKVSIQCGIFLRFVVGDQAESDWGGSRREDQG